MSIKYIILLIIAIFIEVVAFIYIYFNHSLSDIFLFFVIHLISSFISSFVGYMLLPDRFKKQKFYTFIFTFVFSFTLSIIAIPAFIIFSKTLRKQKEIDTHYYQTFFIDKLLILDEIKLQKRFLGEAGIAVYIKNKNLDSNLRLKAFLIISEIISPLSVEYFKLGLSDTNDEIRLLSFSQINGLEKKINNEVFALKTKLKSNPDDSNLKIQIAKLLWELIYLRLVDDTFEKILIKEILGYLEGVESEEALYLLLKIYIKQKNYRKAEEVVEKLGVNLETIQYILEIEYYKRHYKRVKELVEMHPDVRLIEKFYFIYRLWHDS